MKEVIQRENAWNKLRLANLWDVKPGYHWSTACNAWLPNSIKDTYTKEHYNSPYIGAHMSKEEEACNCWCRGDEFKAPEQHSNSCPWSKPEGEQMLQLSENDHDTQCHARAKNRGQKTFTLVEQDDSAPEVICEWIKDNIRTCTRAKLEEALDTAINWAQESKVGKKHAD